MKHWPPEEIAKWHAKIFPNATEASQLLKLEEELKERLNAGPAECRMEETADVIIVCTALKLRWNSRIAEIIADSFCADPVVCEKIAAFVDIKMHENLHRRWKIIPGGEYIEQAAE